MILDGLIQCFSEALFCSDVSEPTIHPLTFHKLAFLEEKLTAELGFLVLMIIMY